MPANFWSFIYVIVEGSWAKVGSDISTSLEMKVILRQVEISLPGSGTFDNNINKWPKLCRHPCMISNNFKKAILSYVYYMQGYMHRNMTKAVNISYLKYCITDAKLCS